MLFSLSLNINRLTSLARVAISFPGPVSVTNLDLLTKDKEGLLVIHATPPPPPPVDQETNANSKNAIGEVTLYAHDRDKPLTAPHNKFLSHGVGAPPIARADCRRRLSRAASSLTCDRPLAG